MEGRGDPLRRTFGLDGQIAVVTGTPPRHSRSPGHTWRSRPAMAPPAPGPPRDSPPANSTPLRRLRVRCGLSEQSRRQPAGVKGIECTAQVARGVAQDHLTVSGQQHIRAA